VIAIISLLSSVVLASLSGTREQARKKSARAELQSLRTAMQQLINDTGKWPNGCPPGKYNNPEARLDNKHAGLTQKPNQQNFSGPCEWTQSDVKSWGGPYVQSDTLTDPWGNSYIFDPDYIPYRECSDPDKPQQSGTSVIHSGGPTWNNLINDYDCDDIFVKLN